MDSAKAKLSLSLCSAAKRSSHTNDTDSADQDLPSKISSCKIAFFSRAYFNDGSVWVNLSKKWKISS
ncbi:hypothetical protein K7X08_032904 [Anisodus acutangulus]|uniref:Uncharacterized protein n=1 Tax=Anisodus acutangulus TaxID=402998 RepID=A0A9Q1RCR7_9SOLA|nr:hypothetical protein K7X08_032904 [Anisodus acutangulus]